jgi:biotin synthase-like enzyme
MVRLSAGREQMSDELQALCLLAGANSIFYGEKLLTTGNPDTERDLAPVRARGRASAASQSHGCAARRRALRGRWTRVAELLQQ